MNLKRKIELREEKETGGRRKIKRKESRREREDIGGIEKE